MYYLASMRIKSKIYLSKLIGKNKNTYLYKKIVN